MSDIPSALVQSIESTNVSDRITALNQIRQLDPATGLLAIERLVTDSNVRIRYAAVSQMANVGVANLDRSLDILRTRLLDDPEPDVQAAAADALGALKLTAAYDDLLYLYQNTPEWLVQFSIVAALGEMGEPRGLELLQTALASETSLVQTAAIGAIGELGDVRGIESILPFADSDDWQVRHQVAKSLYHLGGETAQTALAKLAQDPIAQVAEAAIGK
jgi:HEAT repeat protein